MPPKEETLKQVKCYSDNIAGVGDKEDQTEHDIVYKKGLIVK